MSGLKGCTYLWTFGVEMPNKKSGVCGLPNPRLDPPLFEASVKDPYGQQRANTVDVKYGTSPVTSVYGIEFWNAATNQGY